MNALLLIVVLSQVAAGVQPVESHAGLDAGAAVVADVPLMSLKGWFGASRGPLEAGLQLPLRFDIAAGAVRERDWDELADFGRLIRFLRFAPWIEVGQLNEATLGNGTIVRRYHNNIDDDHRRTAARVKVHVDKFEIDGFIDHLLDDPVIAGRAALVLGEFSVGGTFATDTGAPIFVDGTSDGAGNLKGDKDLRAMYGVDFRWTASDTATFKGTVYGDFNGLQNGNPGAHGGLLMEFPTRDGVWITLRLEGMWFGEKYDWAVFDMGYLIDRWSLKWAQIEEFPTSFGGRFGFALDYKEALVLGAEYANTTGLDRSDFSVWLRVPHKSVRFSGLWRRRYADPDELPVDLEQAMAAASFGIKLGPFGWLDGTVAHMYRTTELSTGNSLYEPFNEASLILQMLFF